MEHESKNSAARLFDVVVSTIAKMKSIVVHFEFGRGFPDSPMPQFVADILKDIASHPERTDWHQYTRGFGHPRLVSSLNFVKLHE
uniref:Uncharacterized protein n=1 Tax=Parascaris equorum TaxID=6256 RepID=A0A914RWG3_PAREQ